MAKSLPAKAGDAGDAGLIPWSGRSPGVGNGNPLQFFCLENSRGRGAWQAKSPWGWKVSDMPEQLSTHARSFKGTASHSHTNPLLRNSESLESLKHAWDYNIYSLPYIISLLPKWLRFGKNLLLCINPQPVPKVTFKFLKRMCSL